MIGLQASGPSSGTRVRTSHATMSDSLARRAISGAETSEGKNHALSRTARRSSASSLPAFPRSGGIEHDEDILQHLEDGTIVSVS